MLTSHPHGAQSIINIPVDDDARAGMRLARVAGGIQAGVLALAQRGPDAPAPASRSRERASAELTPTGPANDRPAARNLLALPPQLRERDPGRI